MLEQWERRREEDVADDASWGTRRIGDDIADRDDPGADTEGPSTPELRSFDRSFPK